jgi:hypothetical protein
MSAGTEIRPTLKAFGPLSRSLIATSMLAVTFGSANAQEAIGVPFVGKNHLSFYTTELSRDGIGEERAAIFGGVYGRAFGERTGPVQISVLLRAGARALPGGEDGILDGGVTLAATRALPVITKLSLTGAAGVGAVIWGQKAEAPGISDTGRMSVRVPLSAGAAYDLRAGGATIAPFAMITTAYTREGDYVDDERVALDSGWRVGSAAGVSVRFKEMVFSLSDVRRERGLPHNHRIIFNVGMSW